MIFFGCLPRIIRLIFFRSGKSKEKKKKRKHSKKEDFSDESASATENEESDSEDEQRKRHSKKSEVSARIIIILGTKRTKLNIFLIAFYPYLEAFYY